MKRFCKLFALLLALMLVLTACGGNAATDNDPTGDDTPNGDSTAAEPMMDLGSGLSLMSVNRYAGAFVEDGSDETVSDVLAITVRNDGDKTVQYAQITLTQGGEHLSVQHPHPAGGGVRPGAGAVPPGHAGQHRGPDGPGGHLCGV